jgi:hypothetical protein
MNFLFMFLGGVFYLVARLPSLDIGPTAAQSVSGLIMLSYLLANRRVIRDIQVQS